MNFELNLKLLHILYVFKVFSNSIHLLLKTIRKVLNILFILILFHIKISDVIIVQIWKKMLPIRTIAVMMVVWYLLINTLCHNDLIRLLLVDETPIAWDGWVYGVDSIVLLFHLNTIYIPSPMELLLFHFVVFDYI